jgi:RraA family protein
MSQRPRSAELHPGPGFRVRTGGRPIDPAVLEGLCGFATPDISDLLNRLYAVSGEIRCLTDPQARLCAQACTVKVFPGDNLMVHKALDIARPGEVVVVDAAGATSNAVLGDLISAKARHRGIAGFVVDGLIRDLPAVREVGLPVFARGTTPVGPLHRGPGEINFPVVCGGVVTNPGDIVVADETGMVIVPEGIAAELLERLRGDSARSEAYTAAVRRGEFSNDWVDRLLDDHGCPVDSAP